jgi:hypothetical protein
MSSRWVYHHRRENGVTLENWRLYCDFSGTAHAHACAVRHRKNTTHTHHYILPRSLCIITLSLFSRDRGFSCLEIPISVVIWIGLEGGKKENDAIPTSWSNTSFLFCLLLLGAACTINNFFLMLAACDLFKARIFLLFCWKRNWMDGLIFTSSLRTLVVFLFDSYLLLPPILLNIYKHKKV